jgi:hypothetical protein
MPVVQMTDAEAEEFYGKSGLVLLGPGPRPPAKKKTLANPATGAAPPDENALKGYRLSRGGSKEGPMKSEKLRCSDGSFITNLTPENAADIAELVRQIKADPEKFDLGEKPWERELRIAAVRSQQG